MIIGLCGQKQAGKDTVAAYLMKEHGFERRAFADPLKRSIAALLDIPFHEVDSLKLNPNAMVSIRLHQNDQPKMLVVLKEFTFRHALQRYGTESHRDVFGEDFWLNQALPVDGFYAGRNIVVTDVRFTNEAERINELNGYVIKVVRSELEIDTDRHRSENEEFSPLIDRDLYNNGSLDELYNSIEVLLVSLGAQKWPGEK